MSHKLNKLPKNTYELTVTIPWADIKKAYETAFAHMQSELTVEGFRKGKAPKEIAEKNLSQEKVYNHMMRDMLPEIYEEAVKKEDLKPIVAPKIDLKSAKENEDWEIVFTLAEKPTIDLGDYKAKIKKAKADATSSDIWVPGKEQKEAPTEEEKNQKNMSTALTTLLDSVTIEVPDLIVEEELQQRLSRVIDDIQKLGLTVESYLKSKNLTLEDMKAQYRKEVEDMYKLEFILNEVADQEKIGIDDKDFEELFKHAKTPEELEQAKQNAQYYATFLRKQKTLAFLLEL